MSLNLARSAKRSLPVDSQRLTTAKSIPRSLFSDSSAAAASATPLYVIPKPHRLFQTSALRGLGSDYRFVLSIGINVALNLGNGRAAASTVNHVLLGLRSHADSKR